MLWKGDLYNLEAVSLEGTWNFSTYRCKLLLILFGLRLTTSLWSNSQLLNSTWPIFNSYFLLYIYFSTYLCKLWTLFVGLHLTTPLWCNCQLLNCPVQYLIPVVTVQVYIKLTPVFRLFRNPTSPFVQRKAEVFSLRLWIFR